MNQVKNAFRNTNYFWIVVSALIFVISNWSRAVRWSILLETLGKKPKLYNSFHSVMIMYLANLALPRLGEVSRCGIIKKYEGISFTQAVGTVVVERIADVLMLLILLVLVIITQMGTLLDFLKQNPEVSAKLDSIASHWLTWTIAGLALIAMVIVAYKFRYIVSHFKIYQKITGVFKSLLNGMKTIKNLEGKLFAFFLHSIIIWLTYYLMMYFSFFAFQSTSHLSLSTALMLLVMSSLGMIAPVQGGVGPWDFMIVHTLMLYNISTNDGTDFAIVVHASMIVMQIIGGCVALIMLPRLNKNVVVAQNDTDD